MDISEASVTLRKLPKITNNAGYPFSRHLWTIGIAIDYLMTTPDLTPCVSYFLDWILNDDSYPLDVSIWVYVITGLSMSWKGNQQAAVFSYKSTSKSHIHVETRIVRIWPFRSWQSTEKCVQKVKEGISNTYQKLTIHAFQFQSPPDLLVTARYTARILAKWRKALFAAVH